MAERDRNASRSLLYSLISSPSADGLFHDLEEFRSEKGKDSETFLYWDTFIQMVRLAKNLVRPDREGDWALNLHLQSVEAVLPYFAAFDYNNYLRWSSIHIEE